MEITERNWVGNVTAGWQSVIGRLNWRRHKACNIPALIPRYDVFLIQVKRLEAESSR